LIAFVRANLKELRQSGAFDNVLNGIDAIAHTASPFHTHADDPNGDFRVQSTDMLPLTPVLDIIEPAVNGTKSILESAVKNGCVLVPTPMDLLLNSRVSKVLPSSASLSRLPLSLSVSPREPNVSTPKRNGTNLPSRR